MNHSARRANKAFLRKPVGVATSTTNESSRRPAGGRMLQLPPTVEDFS
jgi:hypothetical protein